MTDIGATLRAAREEQNLTLADAEAGTRIRVQFLEALENEQFELLGGDLYVRGFLRNYAAFLNIDPAPLLEQLGPPSTVPQQSDLHEQKNRYLAEPLQSNPFPLTRIFLMLLGLVLLAAVGLSLWWQPEQRERFLADLGVVVPITATTTPNMADELESRILATQTAAAAEAHTVTPSDGSVATPVPTATLPPRTPTPDLTATAEAPTATPEREEMDEIIIEAEVTDRTWVRVRVDSQQNPLVERILTPGENFEWVGKQQISVRVGNAGGLRLSLNGEELGYLGAPGEVIERHWERDPESGEPIMIDPEGSARN